MIQTASAGPNGVLGRNLLAGAVANDADFKNGGHEFIYINVYTNSRILILMDQGGSPVIGKIFA